MMPDINPLLVDKYHVFFEQATDAILLIDPNKGKLIEANSKATELLGYTKEELTNMTLSDLDVVETTEQTIQHAKEIAQGARDFFETKQRRKDGVIIDVEVSVHPIDIEGKTILLAVWRDISRRKLIEDALRERDRQFQSITAASPDTLLVTRLSDGLIMYVNEQAKNLIGLPASELINQHAPDFYYNPKDRTTFVEMLKHGDVNSWEVMIKRVDGTTIWTLVSARLGTFEGEQVCYTGLRDISEKKTGGGGFADKRGKFQNPRRITACYHSHRSG